MRTIFTRCSVTIFILFIATQTALGFSEKQLDNYTKELVNNKVIPEKPSLDEEVTEAAFLEYLLLNSKDFNRDQKLKLPRNSFTNVPKINPKSLYIYTALDAELIEMNPDKIYDFKKKITRIEALNMVFDIYGISVPKLRKPTTSFTDLPANSKFTPIIARAIELNLIDPVSEKTFGLTQTMKMREVIRLLGSVNDSTEDVQKTSVLIVNQSQIPHQDVMTDVYKKIQEYYVYNNEIKKDQLSYGAIRGMVDSLDDRYSVFNTPEGTEQFISTTSGEFEGIGMWIEKEGEYISVGGVVPDSPAEKAHLKIGDLILKIDGENAKGWTPEEVAAKIKGPAGSEVTLLLQKHPSGNKETVKVKREKIVISFVHSEILEKKYAYIDVSQFPQDIKVNFDKAVKATVTPDTQGLILDLRNNPGGYVSSAEEILAYFLKKGETMYYLDYRSGDKVIKAKENGSLRHLPLVVLTDQSSASASEIVAASLKEHKIATIIGKTTFGKGVAQQVFFYEDGSSLKLTVAEWLSPLKNLINKKGVTPDIEILDDPKTERDEALDRAIRYFKNGN